MTKYVHSGDFLNEEEHPDNSTGKVIKSVEIMIEGVNIQDSQHNQEKDSSRDQDTNDQPEKKENENEHEHQHQDMEASDELGEANPGKKAAKFYGELGVVHQQKTNAPSFSNEKNEDAPSNSDPTEQDSKLHNERVVFRPNKTEIEASKELDQPESKKQEVKSNIESDVVKYKTTSKSEPNSKPEPKSKSKSEYESDSEREAESNSEPELEAKSEPQSDDSNSDPRADKKDHESSKEQEPKEEPKNDKNLSQKSDNEDSSSEADDEETNNDQDMEASDELGQDEQDPPQKSFFARLFGFDSEEEDESDESDESDASNENDNNEKYESLSKKPKKSEESLKAETQSKEPVKKSAAKDSSNEKKGPERSDSLLESIMHFQGNDDIPTSLDDTKKTLTDVMGLGTSFDIAFREMSFGGRKAALVCVTGFVNDAILDQIIKRLTYLTPQDIDSDALVSFITEYIPHLQVVKGKQLSESINKILKGMSAIFVEGESQVILMDVRSYPMRSPSEPTIERVVRGARDGFTETLLSNVSLVRRRIRDPGLKLELLSVGRRTRTDICVAYIDDIADKVQVEAVTEKIKKVNIDGIPLADKQLEEAIMGGGWNPYPLVRYSERPDVVASHLLEGRVVVFVDTSPSVMVLPTTFFDLCLHAEENRQTPFIGSYLRWVRFIGIFSSMFLLPLWMLLVLHPELKPTALEFIGPQKMARIPLLAQFLFVEFGVDLLRMAAVHTPTPLGSAMGLIAAVLIGDIAVKTGLFVNEVILYMAVAAIGMFATPSYELGLANRIVRLVLLLAVSAFQVPGFVISSTLLIILLTVNRSYNSSYLWPFIPFNARAMGAILLRQPVLDTKLRPSFNKTSDNTRVPKSKSTRRQS